MVLRSEEHQKGESKQDEYRYRDGDKCKEKAMREELELFFERRPDDENTEVLYLICWDFTDSLVEALHPLGITEDPC